MNIKQDPRHYYLKGLLRQCYKSRFDNGQRTYAVTQNYRMPGQSADEVAHMTEAHVMATAIDYIAELEAEVERLQYVSRIIAAAKESANE